MHTWRELVNSSILQLPKRHMGGLSFSHVENAITFIGRIEKMCMSIWYVMVLWGIRPIGFSMGKLSIQTHHLLHTPPWVTNSHLGAWQVLWPGLLVRSKRIGQVLTSHKASRSSSPHQPTASHLTHMMNLAWSSLVASSHMKLNCLEGAPVNHIRPNHNSRAPASHLGSAQPSKALVSCIRLR